MRKTATVLMVALSSWLGGCAHFDESGGLVVTPIPITGLPQNIQDDLKYIQDGVVKACGFLPTLNTVANVLGTFTGGQPIVAIASQVITAMCNAITPAHSMRRHGGRYGGALPQVNGVVLHGRFVR